MYKPIEQISLHLVRLFDTLDAQHWLTSNEAAAVAEVAPRTARAHLKAMADAGLLEANAAVFGGIRYRLIPGWKKHHLAKQIEDAATTMGIPRNRKEKDAKP